MEGKSWKGLRESRHIYLNQALEQLSRKVDRLAYLKSKIETGNDEEEHTIAGGGKAMKEPEVTMSLSTTLEQAPERIKECSHRINLLIDEIRGLLF